MEKHNRLKTLRILNKMSQQALAMKTELKQASVANYERGTYGIPEGSINKLSHVLNVDRAYLTYGYPALSGKVWQPPAEGKGLHKDLAELLPQFLAENGFNTFAIRRYLNGYIFLLEADDGRKCLMLASDQNWKTIEDAVYAKKSMQTDELFGHDFKADEVVHTLISDFKPSHFGLDLPADYFEWTDVHEASTFGQDVNVTMDLLFDVVLPSMFEEVFSHATDLNQAGELAEKAMQEVRNATKATVAKLLIWADNHASEPSLALDVHNNEVSVLTSDIRRIVCDAKASMP